MKKILVIIPVYNGRSTIKEIVDRVGKEIIIVDDSLTGWNKRGLKKFKYGKCYCNLLI